jgi:hypothetical protein
MSAAPCKGCERRRKEMALLLEATKQWAQNPTGPNAHEIYIQLRNEAIARGEYDVEPTDKLV